MLAEAFQWLADWMKPTVHFLEDVHGVTTSYSTKPLHQVIAEPCKLPALIQVHTLTGLRDLMVSGLEGVTLKGNGATPTIVPTFPSEYLIHIQDHCSVALKHDRSDKYGRRLSLVVAVPVPFQQFQFGSWIPQEDFIIGVSSLIADGQDKDYVLKTASSITNEATSLNEDNGFAQTATLKAGLAHKQTVTIKPKVQLAPFRTFPELEQPVSEFVFRARNADGKTHFMLVEADGGLWKNEAIRAIERYIHAFDLGVSIIA